MPQIRYGFVHSDQGTDWIIAGIISVGEGLRWPSHAFVGLQFPNGESKIIESLEHGPQFTDDYSAYDDYDYHLFIDVEISEKQYDNVLVFISQNVGHEGYGWNDLPAGAIHDLFGEKAGLIAAAILGSDKTEDCSHFSTGMARVCWPGFMPGELGPEITPADECEALLAYLTANKIPFTVKKGTKTP